MNKKSLIVGVDGSEGSRAAVDEAPLHEGDLTAGTSFEFELSLPADALPNYESEHGELYWEVDAKSNEFARDTHERSRIEVGPPSVVSRMSRQSQPPHPRIALAGLTRPRPR